MLFHTVPKDPIDTRLIFVAVGGVLFEPGDYISISCFLSLLVAINGGLTVRMIDRKRRLGKASAIARHNTIERRSLRTGNLKIILEIVSWQG